MASSFLDDRGGVVRLGKELGRGGEGSVFAVEGQPNLVAKIYHQALDDTRSQKLLTMVGGTDDQLIKIAAWPVRTLHRTHLGPVNGFVMPKITNFHELHVLHGPKSRLQHFPTAGWPFLVHTAANAARAFAAIHSHGHVVGDVNDRNLLVSDAATVKFIDCDSFQIRSGSTTFRCEVGVPTHTAPELQGQSLKAAVRTENHDAFGLAVLLFQLLFMGRHPFAGIPMEPVDMPIERAIAEYRFAYGPRAGSRGMKSPPAAAPLEILPPSLAAQFERAFSNQGAIIARPRASDWVVELDALSRSLKQCAQDSGHFYYGKLSTCPWCSLQAASGLVLFTAVVTPQQTTLTSTLSGGNIDHIIGWLETVTSPGPLPPVPVPASIKLAPSSAVLQASLELRGRRRRGVGLGVAGFILTIIVWPSSVLLAIAIVVVALTLSIRTFKSEPEVVKAARTRARQDRDKASVEWRLLQERWRRASADQFDLQHQRLKQQAAELRNLSATRDVQIRSLSSTAHAKHLKRYLQIHTIGAANIPGIGPGRVSTLDFNGIRTAADITPAVGTIRGIGPVYANRLLDWRRHLENQFSGQSSQAVTPADIAEVDKEISVRRAQLIQEIKQGEASLKQLRGHILAERQAVQPLLESAVRTMRQAEVDLAAL